MEIIYSAAGDKGLLRQENQDCIFLSGQRTQHSASSLHYEGKCNTEDTPLLVAVFDGMGGESCGAQASFLAAETMEKLFLESSATELKAFCTRMNDKICAYMKEHGIRSMGTTAAVMRFLPGSAQLCNIGDSRIYRLSRGELKQLSVDHIMKFGVPPRRVLTQNLGIPQEEMNIEPSFRMVRLQPGDTFLLCTDGLTDMVADPQILKIMQNDRAEDISGQLVEAALRNGGRDNVSAIVCRVR